MGARDSPWRGPRSSSRSGFSGPRKEVGYARRSRRRHRRTPSLPRDATIAPERIQHAELLERHHARYVPRSRIRRTEAGGWAIGPVAAAPVFAVTRCSVWSGPLGSVDVNVHVRMEFFEERVNRLVWKDVFYCFFHWTLDWISSGCI